MSFVTRAAKKSPRLFTIVLLIAMVSTLVLASRWESVKAYTFGSAAVSGQTESSGKLKKSALVDGFVKDDLFLAPGSCDTAGQIEVEGTLVGTTPTAYVTLNAAFAAINAGTHTGDITIDVCGDTTETATAVLNASGSGAASYTSVIIAPAGGAARTISGNLALPLIDFSGADNVTINGLNAGGNSLTISNASTVTTAGTSTIRFINDATGNTIQNATINGAATGTSTATVLFSSTTGTTGNDNNTVTTSNIGPVGSTFPLQAIQSIGTTTNQTTRNSGIQITNNNIFDFYNSGATVAVGILASGSTDWTITGNSLYQTASRTMASSGGFIGISMADTSGVNFNISNNFIGGSAASAGGSAWTQTGATTHTFIGIRMSVGTTTPSSLQGNTIQNISVSTSSTSTVNAAISAVTGAMNIGTTTGNTIGSTTGTGSITWTGGGTAGQFAGILAGTGTPGGINISNNNIGGITVAGAGTTTLYGIRFQGTATAAYTVSGNTIGSNTTANSIQNSTNLATVGISGSQTGFGATVSNNTVRNLNASSTGTAVSLRGIELLGSVSNQTISGNTIRDFTTASGNTGTTGTAAVNGIVLTGSATTGNTITANTIRDLASTVSSATAVFNNGITITSTPATTISRNLIFNLTTAASSPTSSINGIYLFNSSATENVHNNMVRLGTGVGNNPIIRGIWDNTATSSPTNIYFNSVFIDGTQGAATVNTACISKVVSSTMDVKNNILWNNRASTGAPGAGTGHHYGIQVTSGTVTSNFNDIYTPNTGGAIGFLTADRITLTDWRTNTSQDLNSSNADPQFIDATNATNPNLHINPAMTTVIEGNGTPVSPPTDDFDGQTRASLTPVDIGADAGNFMGIDLAPPTITYTTLGNTTTTTDRILSISVTDVSGVPTSGVGLPVLYFRKGTSGAYSASQCAFVSGSNYDCTITYASVGGVIPGDTIQYYVAAQDNAPTPNVTTNPSTGATGFTANPPAASTPPTTPNSYVISVAFSGTKTVCASGCDYTSLTGAAPGGVFAAINAGVVTGNINLEIAGDLTSEPGTNALNKLSVEPAGSPFTLKLYPTGAPRTISGAAASTALIKLNGADRITIDGSLGGVGTDRSLTIENTSTTSPQVIRIGSIGTTPVTADTVKNCVIRNGVNTSSAVVIIDTGGSAAGYFNNITIQNNDVQRAFIGVFANAALLAGNGSGLLYTQNKLDNTGTNAIRTAGLYVQGADGATVSNNTVGNFNATNDESDTGIWFATGTVNSTITGNTVSTLGYTGTGAFLAYGIRDSGGVAASGNNITQNTVSNITSNGQNTSGPTVIGIETSSGGTTIQRNSVQNVNAVSTGTFGAAGINISASNNSVVKNNFVSNVTGDMTGGAAFSTTFGIFGIRVAAGTGHQIYNNSVNLYGARAGTATSSLLTAAFALVSTASTGVDVRNNIFANNITGGTTSVANVAAYLPSGGTSAMNLTWNNNSYYYGTDVARAGVGQAGTTAGTNFYTTLAALTAYTSTLGSATNDNASLASNGAVPFASSSDLHISSGAAEVNTGATIATVTNDYDGDTRPQGAGYEIGADEIIAAVAPTVQFNSATYSGAEGTMATITVTRTGDTSGNSTVNYATTDGTATGGGSCGVGVDYVTTGGKLLFAATETSKTFDVQLCTDGAAKSSETVNLTLSTPSGATLGTPSTAVLTITDVPPVMPGVLALSSAVYSVGEGAGNLTVTVNRTSGSDGAVTVDYALTDGSAVGGSSCSGATDYVNTGGTVNFAGGETSKTFNVAICEDALLEGSETFTIGLQNATGGATIGSPSSATATIIDNEVAAPGSIQFSAPTYTVSEAGPTATITATRTGGSDGAVGVSYATVAGGSATGGASCSGTDYVTASGTLSWPNGDSASKTFSITICDDTVYETPSPETVNLALTTPTGGAVLGAQNTAVLNINENDTQPTLQFAVSSSSTGEGAGTATIQVTRSGALGNVVSVDYATVAGGTATAGSCAPGVDYNAASGTLNWGSGDGATKTFNVTICNDTVYEANQTINLALSNPTGGAALGATTAHVFTINNDDASPTVAMKDISQAEGNSGTTNFQTTFDVTGASEVAGSFSFQTADNTATAPSDYTAVSSTPISVPADVNRTTATVNAGIVSVNGDTMFEANETFFLNGSLCNNCSFTDNQGLATIQNDDVQPTVQFSSATYSNSDDIAKLAALKGDELAPEVATITVTRTGATGDAFTVNYATSNGTATGGASCTTGVDYISASGVLSFAAGDTSKTFNVTVCADNLFEGSETVNLALTSPSAPVLLGTPSTAVLTLQDNETVPTLQFSSATYSNSDDIAKFGITTDEFAPSVATITVTRTGAVDNAVTVNYATSNGTATGGASCTPGVDYVNASGTLSFGAGVISQTFNVTVCTDALFEGNETVNLTLSSPSAPAALGTPNSAVLTIVDNDAQPSLQFSSATYSVGEGGGSATITVTRTGAVDNGVSVNYSTVAGGTATGGASCGGATDYQNTSGTLSFAGGETSKTFNVPVCDDALAESSETVNLALSAPSGGAVLGAQSSAVLTITDNDSAPTLQFSSATDSYAEGAGNALLVVTRTGATGNAVSVDFTTGGGSATGGASCLPGIDYVSTSGTLNFASGDTFKTISVTLCNDAVYELSQTFNVTLSNATGGATIGTPSTETVTITNDDNAPQLSINDVTMSEGNSGTTSFIFTVTKSGATEVNATVDFLTSNGTASIFDNDYVPNAGNLTFLPADTTKTVTVLVNGDTNVEPDENFNIEIRNPVNATIGDGFGVGNITNDDARFQFSTLSTTVGEGVGSVTFTVSRSGFTGSAATVDFATASGTATGGASCGAGVDFVNNSGTLNFASGDASKTFNVTICDDAAVEGTEAFSATLSNPTGGVLLGTPSTENVLVTDNDSDSTAPVISYTPIASNPVSTSLTATVTDAVGVTGVSIFWSINGGSYTSAPCSSAGGTPQNGTWTCIITGASNPSAVAYYVTATDAAANTGTNPTGGATAPNLFTIGAATVPAGTYTHLSLGQGATLGGNVTVTGVLTLGGVVNTGANTLTLECNASIAGGGETSYVIGNIEKRFCGLGTFTYHTGAAFALPPVTEENTLTAPEGILSNYSPVTVQILGGDVGSSLTVSATDAFMAGAVQTNSISRYWTLTENGNLTANLTFTYRNEDVVGNESSYNVLRRAGGMTSNYPGGTVNGTNNTFSALNVSDFSQWSAGIAVPTAASAEISGRLVTASGEGIRNATVMLTGGDLTHPVYVQTGTFGAYRFTDLAVGQIYVVTVISKRYTFANPSRVVNLHDTVTDENFVANEQ